MVWTFSDERPWQGMRPSILEEASSYGLECVEERGTYNYMPGLCSFFHPAKLYELDLVL